MQKMSDGCHNLSYPKGENMDTTGTQMSKLTQFLNQILNFRSLWDWAPLPWYKIEKKNRKLHKNGYAEDEWSRHKSSYPKGQHMGTTGTQMSKLTQLPNQILSFKSLWDWAPLPRYEIEKKTGKKLHDNGYVEDEWCVTQVHFIRTSSSCHVYRKFCIKKNRETFVDITAGFDTNNVIRLWSCKKFQEFCLLKILHKNKSWTYQNLTLKFETLWEVHRIWKKSSSWFWHLLSKSADLSKPTGRFLEILRVSQKVRILTKALIGKLQVFQRLGFIETI